MKIFIHRSILLLLIVLQGFAPLVHAHAHVQADGSNMGLHFHGFNAQLSQQTEVAALDNFGHCDAVIDIKLAIVQKKSLDSEQASDCFTLGNVNSIPAIAIIKNIASSAYIIPIKVSQRPLAAIPRGPPL